MTRDSQPTNATLMARCHAAVPRGVGTITIQFDPLQTSINALDSFKTTLTEPT